MKLLDNFLKVLKTDRNTFFTYILTMISSYIVIDRLVEILLMIFTGISYSYWGPIQYTLALACPVFAFLFSPSSKFSSTHHDKLQLFYVYTISLYVVILSMFVQWINSALWMGLMSVPAYSLIATDFAYLIKPAFTAIALFLPLTTFYPLLKFLYTKVNESSTFKDSIYDYSGISLSKSKNNTGTYSCELPICTNVDSGKTIKLPEKSRFTSLLVSGPSGCGKTSLIFEPMIARDIEKKAFFSSVAKELGFSALKADIAYIDMPYNNEYLNKNFNLNMLKPNIDKKDTFKNYMSKLILNTNGDNIVYKNLGLTSISPDFETISKMSNVAKNFKINYYLVDPLNPNSIGINPFVFEDSLQSAIAISSILKGLYDFSNIDTDTMFKENISFQAVENISLILSEMYPRLHDGDLPTLEDLLLMLNDFSLIEDMCEKLIENDELSKKYHILISYFKKYFYKDASGKEDAEKFVRLISSQLDNLLRHPGVKNILCNRTNNINFDKVLENGDFVFACTRRGDLGSSAHKSFGLFFILLMQYSVLRRPGNEFSRIPHFLYIDEFPDYICKSTEPIFTVYRKYKVATTISAQNLQQLEGPTNNENLRKIILANCANKITFGGNEPSENDWWEKEFGGRKEWQYSESYEVSNYNVNAVDTKGKVSAKMGFSTNLSGGKVQGLTFKKCAYKIKNDKGKASVGLGNLDFISSKYLSAQSIKTYDFERIFGKVTSDDIKPRRKKKSTIETDVFENTSTEIDPVQVDVSDSKYLFDNEDAIIFNLKKGNSN